MRQIIECPMELKALGDTGSFSGYASIFGNVDQGGDVMERGSFKEFHKTRDGKVLILYQHSTRDPIGKADVTQDDKGLHFDGQLVMEDAIARKCYVGMKAGTIDAMSFGFDVLPGGATITEAGIRKVSAVKLWEISPVTFGMNELARIEAVKSLPQFETIRECESWLRDEVGLTNSAAKEFVARFKKALVRDEPPRDEASADVKETLAFLQTFAKSQS